MRYRKGDLPTGPGIVIHYHHWRPEETPGRRLLVVHGLGDHGGRYEHLAQAAVARGWEVLAPDLRGHGRSGGQRGHVGRFEEYLDDLVAAVSQRTGDGLPLAVFGHSMGGLVATRLVASGRVAAAALALSSPLFGLAQPVGWFWRVLSKVLGPTIPRASFENGLSDADATRDQAMIAERRNDPLTHNRVTARWFCEISASLEQIHDEAPELELPLFLMQADDDRMVSTEASRRFFEQVASRDKQFRLYDAHYHELLREITRTEIIDELLDWLDPRVVVRRCVESCEMKVES